MFSGNLKRRGRERVKENQLIMNHEPNEFITFIPKRNEYLVEHSSVIVGGGDISTASLTVTNLWVVLDRNLTMA